jgi:rubrerythrin
MSASYALSLLESFEKHLGDLYDLFAQLHAGDPEVAALFARLALEERGHASEIAYQGRIIDANPEAFRGILIDTADLMTEMVKLKRAWVTARSRSADEALRAAIEFETSAADYHGRMAVGQVNGEFASFLSSLGGDDEEHRERLARVVDRRVGGARPSEATRA